MCRPPQAGCEHWPPLPLGTHSQPARSCVQCLSLALSGAATSSSASNQWPWAKGEICAGIKKAFCTISEKKTAEEEPSGKSPHFKTGVVRPEPAPVPTCPAALTGEQGCLLQVCFCRAAARFAGTRTSISPTTSQGSYLSRPRILRFLKSSKLFFSHVGGF